MPVFGCLNVIEITLTQKFLMATRIKFLKSLHNLEQLCTFIWSIKNGSFLCQINYAVLVEFGISEDSCVICAKFTSQRQPLRRKNTWVMASKFVCGKLQTFLWKWWFLKIILNIRGYIFLCGFAIELFGKMLQKASVNWENIVQLPLFLIFFLLKLIE